MKNEVEFKIEQFTKFYDCLMENAPKGYTPWFFPCVKNGKNPDPLAIMKNAPEKSLCCSADWVKRQTMEEQEKGSNANPQWRCNNCEKTKGSWHGLHARLNKEQVTEHIKQGWNIGFSARESDPLIIGDIDEAEYMSQMPKDTLTQTSRKRCGGHFIGWDKDGSAKINLPTDYGELRSSNQYVLCCGSYVPFNLKNEKDKKAFDNLTKEAQEDELLGYYTIRDEVNPRPLSFEDCPQFFQDEKRLDDISDNEIIQREEKKTYEDKGGKYSELFKLKMSDIVSSAGANKRTGHPLHESDTDANFSLSKDGNFGHCWRHLVSLNAVQYLCVKAGYAKCQDAGTPHDSKVKDGKDRVRFSKLKGDKKALEVAYNEALKLGLIQEWCKGSIEHINKDFLVFNHKGDVIAVKIDAVAEHIENKFAVRTIYGLREETIEVYGDGYWKEKGRGIIKAEVENLLGIYSKNNVVSEVLEKIKRRTETSREEINNIPNKKRCVKNGVLDFEDINNVVLLPHDKKYNFRCRWEMDYNPDVKSVKYLELLNEALDEEDIPKFQQWNGLHLVRKYEKKKFVILHGPKDTSKTVVMNHLTIALNHNVSGLPLQDISKGKPFDLLVLKDKDANICDDLSSSDMKAIGGVKKSVGDGFIDGEQKFGDKIRFPNTAKQTYACNKIPNPGDDIDDESYYGRIMLFAFDNVISEDKQDQYLIDKITTAEELSGWLNWALDGYRTLQTQNKFSNDLSPEETKYFMIKNGNSLAEFSSEVLIEKAGSKITKDDMYKLYCKWCLEHKPKLSPDSKEKIGRCLTKFTPYTQASKSGSERYWLNVEINEDSGLTLISDGTNENQQTRDTKDTSLNNIRISQDSINDVKKSINESESELYNISESVPTATKNRTYVSDGKNISCGTSVKLCPKCNGETEFRKTMKGKQYLCKDYAHCGGIAK